MQGRCPVRDRIFIAFEMPITLPKSREGRNRHGKDIMTKGAFGRILNELPRRKQRGIYKTLNAPRDEVLNPGCAINMPSLRDWVMFFGIVLL